MVDLTLANVDDYENAQKQADVGAANFIMDTTPEKPDDTAQAMHLAKSYSDTYGTPVAPRAMALQFKSDLAAGLERAKNTTILSNAPVLAGWTRDPDNGALAKDDLHNLSWWESGAKNVSADLQIAGLGMKQQGQQFLADAALDRVRTQGMSFPELIADQQKDHTPVYNFMMGPIQLYNAANQAIGNRISQAAGIDDKKAALQRTMNVGVINKEQNAIQPSEAGTRFNQTVNTLLTGQLKNPMMAQDNPDGLFREGNIDLTKRPTVKLDGGEIATVRSMSFQDEEGGPEILVPTVSPDGKLLSNKEAIELYHKTGQHLGMFDTPDQADAYAEALHQQQDRMYGAALPWYEQLQPYFAAVAADPGGFGASMLDTTIQSLPMMATATLATAVTKDPAIGAVAMGIQSFANERYTTPGDFFNAMGIDISTPEGASAVLSTPSLMQDAQRRGLIRGTIIGVLDGLSGGVAGRELMKNPIADHAVQLMVQAAMGGGGEAAAQYVTTGKVNMQDVLAEAFAEAVGSPLEVLGVGGKAFIQNREKAKAAGVRVDFFKAMSDSAQASALRARLPEKFREYVDKATANGPIENVYVPADKFVEYFQSKGIDPGEAASALDGVTLDDLNLAAASGGDLKIPTASYATHLAGTEHDQFFQENMKFQPDAMTATQAKEFDAAMEQHLQETMEMAADMHAREDAMRPHEQEIYDTMVSRLRAAGRSTEVATTEAMLYPAFYRTMAARSQLTIDEFMARYPLPQVQGAVPAALQPARGGALTQTLATARAQRKTINATGPKYPLLEFIHDYGGIVDTGGELHGRDVALVKQGKGKRNLRIARDPDKAGAPKAGRSHGIDDVAHAAMEAGFMADDPAVKAWRQASQDGTVQPDITQALYAAIDKELAGTPSRAGQETAKDDATRQLDDIQRYLEEIGTSLDATDDEISTAIDAAKGREYGQASHLFDRDKTNWGTVVRENNGTNTISVKDPARVNDPFYADSGNLHYTETADALKIDMVTVSKGSRGQGAAIAMYERLGQIAKEKGKSIVSDVSVSADAVHVYEALARRGYEVERNPNAVASDKGALYDRKNGKPVFTIKPDGIPSGSSFSQDEKGVIQFPAAGVGSGDTVIRLFEGADLSTMLHESGHYFLTVMQDMARKGEEGSSTDFNDVMSWWHDSAAAVAKDAGPGVTADDVRKAIETGTTGDETKNAAVDKGMQEQFARAFEGYLMEGKAPDEGLRGAFQKFRSWLVSVYKNLRGLNANLSPEISRVFDRMLASDEQIQNAQIESGDALPGFTMAEQLGMTPKQWEDFQAKKAAAEGDAQRRLLREVQVPILREQKAWYKKELADVGKEVEDELNSEPVYRAIEWLAKGKWYGENQPEDMPLLKLNRKQLVDRYEEGIIATLPRGVSHADGVDVDEAAGIFGFSSGDEMVHAMRDAPDRKEAIKAETARRMDERHGDILNDGRIEGEALAVVNNERRGEWIAEELKAVSEIAGLPKAMKAADARQLAKNAIGRMTVRDAMNDKVYLSAMRKASEEAARLAKVLGSDAAWLQMAETRIRAQAKTGDAGKVNAAIEQRNAIADSKNTPRLDQQTGEIKTTHSAGLNETIQKFADAKRRQLINHSLYVESRRVQAEVAKAERFVNKLGKASTRERIGGAGRRDDATIDYLGAIDEILTEYDFSRMNARQEQRRGALAAWVEAMKAAGRENEMTTMSPEMISGALARPYRTLGVDEFRGVVATLKNLEHTASLWNRHLDDINKKTKDESVDAIVQAFQENLRPRPPGATVRAGENFRTRARQFLNISLNASTLLREIDGFKDFGAVFSLIKRPIDEGMNRLVVGRKKATATMEKLMSVYSYKERAAMQTKVFIPEINWSLNKWERIAVALNMGNAGNLERLLNGEQRQWNAAQVQAIVSTLDERDAKFVQGVWDFIGSYKEAIGAAERRRTGVEPKWVDAQPVNIGGVDLRGGYYPIAYDPRLGGNVIDEDVNDLAAMIAGGRVSKAQTKDGHTQARATTTKRDLNLDMGRVVQSHVNQVLTDLELGDAVTNANGLLNDKRTQSAFINYGRSADLDALQVWLQDTAAGQMHSNSIIGVAARKMKNNFTFAKLALNVASAAVQISGTAQTAVVLGKKYTALGIRDSFNPNMVSQIKEKSSFMAEREDTFNKDMSDFFNDNTKGAKATYYSDFKKGAGKVAFYLIQKVQYYTADVPSWLGGYHKGMEQFNNDEAKAIAFADDIVKRSQGSGLIQDRSAMERGTVSRKIRQLDFVRLFTALGSYTFTKANAAYERSVVAGKVIRENGASLRSAQEALSYSVDMAFLFTLESVVSAAIKGQLFQNKDHEDENWLKWLAEQTAWSLASVIPGVRDVAPVIQGNTAGGAYGSVTKDLATPFAKIMNGKANDKAFVKSVVSATGVAGGVPSVAINRIIDSEDRRQSGAPGWSPLEYLMGQRHSNK